MSSLLVTPLFINPIVFIGHHVPQAMPGNGDSVANETNLTSALLEKQLKV